MTQKFRELKSISRHRCPPHLSGCFRSEKGRSLANCILSRRREQNVLFREIKFPKPTFNSKFPRTKSHTSELFFSIFQIKETKFMTQHFNERMISLYPNPSTQYVKFNQVLFYVCPHPLSSKTKHQVSFRHSYYFFCNKYFSGLYSTVFVISKNSHGFKSIDLWCIARFVKSLLYSLQTYLL